METNSDHPGLYRGTFVGADRNFNTRRPCIPIPFLLSAAIQPFGEEAAHGIYPAAPDGAGNQGTTPSRLPHLRRRVGFGIFLS